MSLIFLSHFDLVCFYRQVQISKPTDDSNVAQNLPLYVSPDLSKFLALGFLHVAALLA